MDKYGLWIIGFMFIYALFEIIKDALRGMKYDKKKKRKR